MSEESAQALEARGRALRSAGRIEEARELLYRAFQIDASRFDALMGCGECCVALNDFDAALQVFAIAQQRRPDDVAAVFNLGAALETQGNPVAAVQYYERANQLRPRAHTTLLAATRQPIMFDSVEEIRTWRTRLEENLARLKREGLRVDIERIPAPMLNIAYQGLDDRAVLADFASMIAPPADEALVARNDARLRVGFISAFFRAHSIGRMTKGLIAKLSRPEFHVTVLSLGRHGDGDAAFIRQHADAYVEVPRSLPEARRLIRAQALDVLIYTDIGLENFTYTLAFSRLARVQCATWGHPSTTGIPAIDYFISTELFEGERAQEQYTEKLVQLKNVPTYYYRPSLAAKAASPLGLSDDVNVYGCLQTLFKLHPEFDGILDGILQRDPKGLVIIPRGSAKLWLDKLGARIRRTMPTTFDRVRFFDALPYEEYLALTARCDVMLAPIHFGAGSTSYEAFAAGVPTVTMPSNLMKGRITHGLYRAMGVIDCVAQSPQEYVEIAVKVGTDREFRNHVSERIRSASHVLFENENAVRELEEFLKNPGRR